MHPLTLNYFTAAYKNTAHLPPIPTLQILGFEDRSSAIM
jgi:hypothetical protein